MRKQRHCVLSELSVCNVHFLDIVLNLYMAAAVPLRSIVAVYHHVRRSHHPLKLQGQWKEHENDLINRDIRVSGLLSWSICLCCLIS